jgi:hypothetical protein
MSTSRSDFFETEVISILIIFSMLRSISFGGFFSLGAASCPVSCGGEAWQAGLRRRISRSELKLMVHSKNQGND